MAGRTQGRPAVQANSGLGDAIPLGLAGRGGSAGRRGREARLDAGGGGLWWTGGLKRQDDAYGDATPLGLMICWEGTQGRPLCRWPTLGSGTQSRWDW